MIEVTATIDRKHLRYFPLVAKFSGNTRARTELHVTSMWISSHLAELEEALGTGPYRRIGRGLEVTGIGRRMSATRRRYLASKTNARRSCGARKRGPRFRVQQPVQRLLHSPTDHFGNMLLRVLFIEPQRTQRRSAVVSHGGLSSGLARGRSATAFEPDRGRRLEMCERNVTLSGLLPLR
jgi:DNA-binding transcriptional LysR family regulator